MDSWSGKYIIGLTGNIATGKSIVLQMLEHLGAFGFDADKAAHRAIAKGTPGYHSVIKVFGDEILAPSGSIDRSILAGIVFNNPNALTILEKIIHPIVGKEIDQLIKITDSDVFVIEAIKLIEAGLHERCDTVWVTVSHRTNQIERLTTKRLMDKSEALTRINSQGSQEDKIPFADVVIQNDSTVQHVWEQVSDAWMIAFPDTNVPQEIPEGIFQIHT